METKIKSTQRIIGLDCHPDVFTATCLEGLNPHTAKIRWVHDQQQVSNLEKWAKKYLLKTDTIALEASGNSFQVVRRFEKMGYKAIVLESQQVGKISNAYCSNDKICATKIARGYLTGLSKEVWKPDATTQERRDLFACYQKSVSTSTRMKCRIRSYLSNNCIRLKAGTRLTTKATLANILKMKDWNTTAKYIIEEYFVELWMAEERRNKLKAIMAQAVLDEPKLRQLLRLMGVKHIIAYAIGAIIGDISRFKTAKN